MPTTLCSYDNNKIISTGFIIMIIEFSFNIKKSPYKQCEIAIYIKTMYRKIQKNFIQGCI